MVTFLPLSTVLFTPMCLSVYAMGDECRVGCLVVPFSSTKALQVIDISVLESVIALLVSSLLAARAARIRRNGTGWEQLASIRDDGAEC